MEISARTNTETLHVFHCTYPNHPSTCVTERIGSVPYRRARFEPKRDAFVRVAEAFGLPTVDARFTDEHERRRGVSWDHSRLIIPGQGSEYYKVAFFS